MLTNYQLLSWQGSRRESTFGMAGNESSPASLLQLYVDYGRYAEATNLLLEYIESVASVVNFKAFLINYNRTRL